jgi:diguanylate cyclase (GGDEF)-like protein
MDGTMQESGVRIGRGALSRLMPMHVCLACDGTITGCGPTLQKLVGSRSVAGKGFFDLFEVRRPEGVASPPDLLARAGQRLHIALRDGRAPGFRGLAVPLESGGALINLSFGITVVEAVRKLALTDADFAPTDLAMELLYLVEAKTAVMEQLRDLNRRLEGAKTAAEEQALTDTLTGLGNRRAMDMALSQLIMRGAPFGLMHLDLDFFKEVNDRLGHAAGDHVLREVARVLRVQTRGGDTVARIGGDEFVVLLPGLVEAATLQAIAARIIAQLGQPILYGEEPCRVSASIGMTVSTAYAPPLRSDRLLADADEALYEAKRSGRGRAVFRAPGTGG